MFINPHNYPISFISDRRGWGRGWVDAILMHAYTLEFVHLMIDQLDASIIIIRLISLAPPPLVQISVEHLSQMTILLGCGEIVLLDVKARRFPEPSHAKCPRVAPWGAARVKP
jgi:hypothetical protein